MSSTEKKLRRKLKELIAHEEFMLQVLCDEHPESEQAFCALASVMLNSELILRAKELLEEAQKRNEEKGKNK